MRSNTTLQTIQQELEVRRPALEQAAQDADHQIALIERSVVVLPTANVAQPSGQDEDDIEAALIALEEEISALKTHRDIIQELLDLMQAEKLERLAQRSQSDRVTNNFGPNIRGIQTGTMTGGIINM